MDTDSAVAAFIRAFSNALTSIAEVVQSLSREFAKAARSLAQAFSSIAETEYLRHHQRLPGSAKTARGRKKRLTRVMKWYQRWLTVHSN